MIPNTSIDKIVTAVRGHDVVFPPSVLLAIAEKESNGIFFWNVEGENIPIFRPESHKFYKYLTNVKERNEAVRQRLASSAAGGVGVPASSDKRKIMLDRMCKINSTAALMSISMGFGQVMGFHYKALGYRTVQHMWADAHTIEGQLSMVLRFIELTPPLSRAVAEKDSKQIAYYYNGPAYKKNNYDKDIARYIARYAQFDTERGVPVIPTVIPERPNWVGKIKALGFETVKDFQTQYNLNPDGIIGNLTKTAITEAEKKANAEAKAPERAAVKLGSAGLAVTGITGLASNADAVVGTLRPILDASATLRSYSADVLLLGGGGILCAAVVAFLYARWQRKQ